MNKTKIGEMVETIPIFSGELRESVHGLYNIVFPNMLMAARFVDHLGIGDKAKIHKEDPVRSSGWLNVPLVIQVDARR